MATIHSDEQDLRDYVASQSRDALGRLVMRHIDFVYGVARRHVEDPSLADDVTQAVFLVLARSAAQVKPAALLSWLFVTTRNLAANANKTAARRRYHERRAAILNGAHTMSSAAIPAADLQEDLQRALEDQKEADRSIVLLRYAGELEISEIASVLRISDVAARKRLERALAKLRDLLRRRGAVVGAASVCAALGAIPQAAPPALAATIQAGSVSGSVVTLSNASSIALGMKFKFAAAILLLVGLATGLGLGWPYLFHGQIIAPVATLAQQIAMPTTKPTVAAPAQTVANKITYSGTVTNPSGKPVAGARVWSEQFDLANPLRIVPLEAETTTDAHGKYTLSSLTALDPIAQAVSGIAERFIHIDHPDYAMSWYQRRAESDDADGNGDSNISLASKLESPVDLQVRVTDPEGAPVAGAEVALTLRGRYGYLRFGILKPAVTDANGLAVFKRLSTSVRAQIIVTHASFANFSSYSKTGEMEFVRPGFGAYAATLRPGGRIRVLPPPLQGQTLPLTAYLFATPKPGTPPIATKTLPPTRFDPQLGCLTMGLEPGLYDLFISPSGPKTSDNPAIFGVIRDITITAGHVTDVTPELLPSQVVSGRIVDPQTKAPVVNETVSASSSDPLVPWRTNTTTARDGTFSFRAPPGEATIQVRSYTNEQGVTVTKKVMVGADAPTSAGDLEAVAAPKIRGRLTDPSGRPVAGRVTTDLEHAHTQPDGSFELPPRKIERNKPIALYALSDSKVFGRGIVVDEKLLDPRLAAPGAELPTIALKATARVSGMILDPDGAPAEGAEVMLYDNGMSSSRVGSKVFGLVRQGNHFDFTTVPTGLDLRLSVSMQGSQAQPDVIGLIPGEVRDLGEITLSRLEHRNRNGEAVAPSTQPRDFTGSVIGRVLDTAGNPMPGVRVSAVAEGMNAQPGDTTDHEGRFILDGLPKGEGVNLYASVQALESRQALAAVGATDVEIRMGAEVAADLIGKPAPELAVAEWIVGGPLRMADLRGKVVLIKPGLDSTFTDFASGNQALFDAHARYASKGLVVIGIHCDPRSARPTPMTRDDVANFIRKQNIPFPFGIDAPLRRFTGSEWFGGETASRFHLPDPTMILIDKKGIVRGIVDWANVNAEIEKLLAE